MIGLWSGVHITGTQGRMRGHNRGCVTSQNTLSSHLCVRHLQRKGKWSRSRRKWFFFEKSGTTVCRGSKRMISAMKCALMWAVHCAYIGDQLIATFLLSDNQMLRGRVAAVRLKKKSWRKKPLWNWVRFITSDVTCGAMSGVRIKHHLLVLNWVTL